MHHGDAVSVLRNTASHDLVLADPPYNVGVPYDGYADNLPSDEYFAWCRVWFAECYRIARRHVIVFPGHKYFAQWWQIKPPSGVGCWHKPGCPAGGGAFRWCEWEPWLVWSKGGAWCGYSDTITAPLVSHGQKDSESFPCPKPPKLYAELLKRFSPNSVLDPFMGSGTSGVEAVKQDIVFTGIEQSERYYALCRRRIEEAAGVSARQFTRPGLFEDVP